MAAKTTKAKRSSSKAGRKSSASQGRRRSSRTARESMTERPRIAGKGQRKTQSRGKKVATMNAVQLLRNDHEKVKALFSQYETLEDQNARKKNDIAKKIIMELEIHTSIEEEIFYPAVQAKGDSELKELIADSYDEHKEVKDRIEEIRGKDLQDPEHEEKLRSIIESVEEHIEKEEGELFPEAEERLGDELDRIGAEMEARKDQLMAVH